MPHCQCRSLIYGKQASDRAGARSASLWKCSVQSESKGVFYSEDLMRKF